MLKLLERNIYIQLHQRFVFDLHKIFINTNWQKKCYQMRVIDKYFEQTVETKGFYGTSS